MTPEETRALIEQVIREKFQGLNVLADRVYMERALDMAPNTYIKLGKTVKFSVGGVDPVVQQAKINDPSGGTTIDTQARAAINSLIDVFEAYGQTSTS